VCVASLLAGFAVSSQALTLQSAALPILPATTAAPQVIGVARGATAATRRSMEGTRTGRGIRPRHRRPVRQDDAGRGGVDRRGSPGARRRGAFVWQGALRQPPNHPLSGSRLSSHQRRQNSAIRAIAIPSHSVMASTPRRRSTTSRLSLMKNRDDVH
jgi:hypothetical protein